MKSTSLVLVFALAGCAFAQKHPAITTGLVVGAIGFGTCGLAVERLQICGEVGLAAGVGLGGITGLVTTVFDTGDHGLPQDPDDEPIRRFHSEGPPPGPYLPPEPNPLPLTAQPDAGVPAAADGGAAPSDAQ